MGDLNFLCLKNDYNNFKAFNFFLPRTHTHTHTHTHTLTQIHKFLFQLMDIFFIASVLLQDFPLNQIHIAWTFSEIKRSTIDSINL